MGTQVVKVNRNTGEVLWRGYVNPDTRMSEAWAECATSNALNTDPEIGFVTVDTLTDLMPLSPDYVKARIEIARQHNSWGFNDVLRRDS